MQDSTYSRQESDARPSPRRAVADPHGQAALLLSESILHALVEARTLTLPQAIGVVQTASEVTADIGEEIEGGKGHTQQSLHLLSTIGQSLATGKVETDPIGDVQVLRFPQ